MYHAYGESRFWWIHLGFFLKVPWGRSPDFLTPDLTVALPSKTQAQPITRIKPYCSLCWKYLYSCLSALMHRFQQCLSVWNTCRPGSVTPLSAAHCCPLLAQLNKCRVLFFKITFWRIDYFTVSHLADAFIHNDLKWGHCKQSKNGQVLWQVSVSLTQYT